MGQVLHGGATTTHAIRAAIQRSKAPLKELAAKCSLKRTTVAKWRKRSFLHDAPMGPDPTYAGSMMMTPERDTDVLSWYSDPHERAGEGGRTRVADRPDDASCSR